MNELEKIMELINKKIIFLESQIDEINKKIESNNTSYSLILSKLKNTLTDYKNIIELDDNDFNILEKIYDKNKITNLKVYKVVVTNPSFNFPYYSQMVLNDICNDIIININKYNEEVVIGTKEIEKLNLLLDVLKNLKINIKNNFNINLIELDELMSLVKASDYTDNEKIDLLIYISNISIKSFNLLDTLNVFVDGEEKLENNDIEITNLSEESLIDLFNKYEYNFLALNRTSIAKIKKYGNLENIESMLSVLKTQNIDLNKEMTNKSGAIAEILIYSSADILEKILLLAYKKGLNFHQLIKIPSCFISKRRNFIRLGLNGKTTNQNDNLVGSYEDFEKNIQYLESIFIKVYGEDKFSSSFDKCCFIFIKSHELIKRTIKVYELYGITPIEYLNTLSSLNSYHVEEILDLSIELDCFEYLRKNLSKATLMPNDEQFYMIARARQLGYSDDKIFDSRGLKYKVLKEDENIGINKVNGALKTNKFILNETNKVIFKEFERILIETTRVSEFNFYNGNENLSNSNINIKLKKLDELYLQKDNPLVYNINNISISKNKVLRIYNNLLERNIEDSKELMLFALTYNSIITQEQFDIISDEVNKLYFNKEKKLW